MSHFIYQSYKNNGEPDFDVKTEIRKVAKECGINLLTDQIIETPTGYRRPDLYCPTLNLVVESDGEYHKTKKGRKQTDSRTTDYNELGITCAVFSPDIAATLKLSVKQYMIPIFNSLNTIHRWGIEI